MRKVKSILVSAAALCLGIIIVANWRAHRETQRKIDVLDALVTSLSSRPASSSTPSPADPKPLPPSMVVPAAGAVPRELDKTTPPPYVIEPPDVLVIEAVLRDPRTKQTEQLPVQPVAGQFPVRPDGTVSLGVWGTVRVAGLTSEKAADAIRRKLAAFTQVNGTSTHTENLAVTVEVLEHKSKSYYIITDGGAGGEQMMKLPYTGTETVLDAIAAVPGLAAQADKKSIRVVRPAPTGAGSHTLPVDWNTIIHRGDTRTSYALQPGDRVYVTGGR